jgi:flagellar motor protein MotB
MEPGNLRHDQPYRRGLVLGLTMAEIMLLLVFILLMAMGAALAHRDHDVKRLHQALADRDLSARLHALLQETFPQASDYDGYFKELRFITELRQIVKVPDDPQGLSQLARDAEVGALMRAAAEEDTSRLPQTLRAARVLLGNRQEALSWPPFINLSEADGYFFDSGSARLRPEFRRALETTTADALTRFVKAYQIDVIEVVGHTDEVPMSGASTLDKGLIPAVRGKQSIDALSSCDNAGLGMARAVSVVRVLRAASGLKDVTILPLSGAQMVVPVDTLANGSLSGDSAQRRRIEIRMRRSTGTASIPTADTVARNAGS